VRNEQNGAVAGDKQMQDENESGQTARNKQGGTNRNERRARRVVLQAASMWVIVILCGVTSKMLDEQRAKVNTCEELARTPAEQAGFPPQAL
jgi:hypothetical protein